MKRWLCGWVGSVDGGFVWWCFLWRMVVLCGSDFCEDGEFCDGGTEGIVCIFVASVHHVQRSMPLIILCL